MRIYCQVGFNSGVCACKISIHYILDEPVLRYVSDACGPTDRQKITSFALSVAHYQTGTL